MSTSNLVSIQKNIIVNRLDEARQLILFASNILRDIPRDVGMVNGISVGAGAWANEAMTLAQTIEQGTKDFLGPKTGVEITQSVNKELETEVLAQRLPMSKRLEKIIRDEEV